MTQVELLVAILNSDNVRQRLLEFEFFHSEVVERVVAEEFPKEYRRLLRSWQPVLSHAVRHPECTVRRVPGSHTYQVVESDSPDSLVESGGPAALRRGAKLRPLPGIDVGLDVAGNGVGPLGGPTGDEATFWAAVEEALDPPITRSGCRPNRPQANRHGTFAPNLRLGVVANKNGEMRVHIWSKDPSCVDGLERLAEASRDGALPPTADGRLPILRQAPRGDQSYLEFGWQREGSFTAEIPRTLSYVQWFVALRGGGRGERP